MMTSLLPAAHHLPLRRYLGEVQRQYGLIRFIAMPTLQDRGNTAIDQLFVKPQLSKSWVSPDLPLDDWPDCDSMLDCLAREPRLVLLGDPGSGKSTLLSWLAWRIAASMVARLPDGIDGTIPLVFVLRELPLDTLLSKTEAETAAPGEAFQRLLAALLATPLGLLLNTDEARPLFDTYLAAGKVVLMLDGFDELSLDGRQRVRAAVWDGWRAHPDTRWLITSRIVGYDECRLDGDLPTAEAMHGLAPAVPDELLRDELAKLHEGRTRRYDELDQSLWGGRKHAGGAGTVQSVPHYHVVPFDDVRIRAFAYNWYALRDHPDKANKDAGDFIQQIVKDKATWRLARSPQLLTMMALVFRVRARLPEGRALLYNDIAQAYLEDIDQYRGLAKDQYPLEQKKRWLARIAFEMQCRRPATTATPDQTGIDRHLLASRDEVLGWIEQAMQSSAYQADRAFAEDYLRFVVQRSGLLLPRGEDQFAFLHLTFQEYFAAVFIREQVQHPHFFASRRQAGEVTTKSLQGWASQQLWREVLVFLFELFSQEASWANALLIELFGEQFKVIQTYLDKRSKQKSPGWPKNARDMHQMAWLLERLVINPHSGLAHTAKAQAVELLVDLFMRDMNFPYNNEICIGHLMVDADWHAHTLAVLRVRRPTELYLASVRLQHVDWLAQEFGQLKLLALINCDLHKFPDLSNLPELLSLDISFNEISDLCWVKPYSELRALYLDGCGLRNIEFIRNFNRLNKIAIRSNDIEDFSVINSCSSLRGLAIDGAEDMRWLSGNSGITQLLVCGAAIDMRSIASLSNLKQIWLHQMDDDVALSIAPLAALAKLESIYVHPAQLQDEAAFAAALALQGRRCEWGERRLPSLIIYPNPTPSTPATPRKRRTQQP
ncbi:internalin A [Chitinivorax tropicus]|uniref:Internalin A n=1 Tax=Chitinivorax tropicus TaxID=714531 RepID=A0A840MS15_9PROT|nr:NACHT domain-containing protein [Chitinivorax tropicus]MBB5019927.1 internalin A [Chitinivorax tropicus]